MKKWKLASLLPGFLAINSSDVIAIPDVKRIEPALEGLVVAPLNTSTPLYIAGHRSHQSHSSHSSHRSSSGSSYRSYPSTPAAPAPSPSRQQPSRPQADPLGRPSTPSYTAPKSAAQGSSKADFDKATLIMRVQVGLRIFGYYTDSIDGEMGPNTRSAIKEYRKAMGLATSELIDAQLLNSLGISAQ